LPHDSTKISATGVGIITALAVHPANHNIIYAGSQTSHLFKTTNGGKTWTDISKNYPILGVNNIQINPKNTNEIWLASGYIGYRDKNYGTGLWFSNNGGETWQNRGIVYDPFDKREQKILFTLLINPENPKQMYAADFTTIFYSNDGGISFREVLQVKNKKLLNLKLTPLGEVVAMGNVLYKAEKFGANFIEIMKDFSSENNIKSINRIIVTFNPKAPKNWYALLDAEAKPGFNQKMIFISTNSGKDFVLKNQNFYSSVGFWKMDFEISAIDTSVFYIGGIQLEMSNDGLNTIGSISSNIPRDPNFMHVDVRSMHLLTHQQKEYVYIAHDGGISLVTDKGEKFKSLNGTGLHVAQFWGFDVAKDESFLIGGTQDCGIHRFDFTNWRNTNVYADAYNCVIHPQNPQLVFAATNGGAPAFEKSNDGGFTFQRISGTGSHKQLNDRSFQLIPDENPILLAGTNELMQYQNNSWRALSDMRQQADPRHAEKVSCIRAAKSNTQIIYMAYAYPMWNDQEKLSKLFYTNNGGASWQDITAGLDGVAWGGITTIEIDDQDPNRVWVAFDKEWAGNKVYYSDNAGQKWQNISFNLPNIPVNKLLLLPGSYQTIFAATDLGVYVFHENTWKAYHKGLSNSIISDLEFMACSSKLAASTFGNGVWITEVSEFNRSENPLTFSGISLLKGTHYLDRDIELKRKAKLYIQGDVYLGKGCKIIKNKKAQTFLAEGAKINYCE
jgi:hypothetical protein